MLRTSDLAGLAGVVVIVITFTVLLYKRRNLGKNSGYFIAAIGTFDLVEVCATYYRSLGDNLDAAPLYLFGVNLILFFLLMIYFHGVLEHRKLKMISRGLIVLFLLQYAVSVYLVRDFFLEAPFFNYLIGVSFLFCSICLLLYQTFSSERIFSLPPYFPFWAGISALTTYVGVLPLVGIKKLVTFMHPSMFSGFLLIINILGCTILILAAFKAKR